MLLSWLYLWFSILQNFDKIWCFHQFASSSNFSVYFIKSPSKASTSHSLHPGKVACGCYRNPVKCGHPGTNVKWRCDANAFTRELSGQVLRSHFDTDTGQFTRHVNAPLSQQAPKHARAHIIVTKRHTKPPDFTSVTRNLSYLPVHNKRQHGTKAIKHRINSVLQKRTIHTTPLRHAWANNAKHSNL